MNRVGTTETRPPIRAQTLPRMDETISTTEMGWVLGKEASAVRSMIKGGRIEAVRIVTGFRIPRAEAVRLGRERIEAEAGQKLSDREVERLIDQVIATNQTRS